MVSETQLVDAASRLLHSPLLLNAHERIPRMAKTTRIAVGRRANIAPTGHDVWIRKARTQWFRLSPALVRIDAEKRLKYEPRRAKSHTSIGRSEWEGTDLVELEQFGSQIPVVRGWAHRKREAKAKKSQSKSNAYWLWTRNKHFFHPTRRVPLRKTGQSLQINRRQLRRSC